MMYRISLPADIKRFKNKYYLLQFNEKERRLGRCKLFASSLQFSYSFFVSIHDDFERATIVGIID